MDYDCDYNSNDPTCVEGRTNRFKCTTAEADCDDFQLDGVHNIRASYEKQTDYAWTVDGFNRLTIKTWGSNQIDYSYDSSNNMVGEDHDGDDTDDVVYTYDKLNRLINFSNENYSVAYSYDPFNRRTKKTVTYVEGSDTFERIHKYLYDGWNIVSEEIKTVCTSDDPDTVTEWKLNRYIDHGMDNHVMMETVDCDDDNGNCDPDETTVSKIWFHKDERGNVIAISDGDGIIYERYKYNVYGDHLVLDENFDTKSTPAISPFLWGGSLYEPESDLYWMRNRYYHIGMHRFINQDPIGIWGDANNLGNGFAYVAGMVVEASDPTGLEIYQNNISRIGLKKEMIDFIDSGIIDEAWNSVTDLSDAEVSSTVFKPETSGIRKAGSRHKFGVAIDISVITSRPKGEGPVRLDLFNAKLFAEKIHHLLMNSGFRNSGMRIIVEHTDTNKNNVKSSPGVYEMKPASGNSHLHIDFGGTNTGSSSTLVAEGTIDLSDGSSVDYKEYVNSDGTSLIEYSDGTVVVTDKDDNKIVLKEGDKIKELKADDLAYPIPGGEEPSDKIQNLLMQKMLAKILKQGGEDQPPILTDNSTGPNGVIMFYRNPYYVNKDPMKSIFFDGNDGSGRPMILRNPFAPKNGVIWSNTYEMWQMRGIIQPEVDPWE